jgi:hypothetical protein
VDPDLDADPDPAVFVIELPKMPNKKQIFSKVFCYYFSKVHPCTSFSKIKSQKEVPKQ